MSHWRREDRFSLQPRSECSSLRMEKTQRGKALVILDLDEQMASMLFVVSLLTFVCFYSSFHDLNFSVFLASDIGCLCSLLLSLHLQKLELSFKLFLTSLGKSDLSSQFVVLFDTYQVLNYSCFVIAINYLNKTYLELGKYYIVPQPQLDCRGPVKKQ